LVSYSPIPGDRVLDVEYGQACVGAIAGAKFVLLKDAGHIPQIETSAQLSDAFGIMEIDLMKALDLCF
jgi:hypothetical protein